MIILDPFQQGIISNIISNIISFQQGIISNKHLEFAISFTENIHICLKFGRLSGSHAPAQNARQVIERSI